MTELKAGDVIFERECYFVRGHDSRGGIWMNRYFVSPTQFRTLADARHAAGIDVARMNSSGASVSMVRQKINKDGYWCDVKESEAGK